MELDQHPECDELPDSVGADDDVGPFVLNLCSIPGPISLPQPRSPRLTRFAFFCSRGLEGVSEQCWLHMGYFATRGEAMKWREVLARVYPQAFVSQAQVTFMGEQPTVTEHEIVVRR